MTDQGYTYIGLSAYRTSGQAGDMAYTDEQRSSLGAP